MRRFLTIITVLSKIIIIILGLFLTTLSTERFIDFLDDYLYVKKEEEIYKNCWLSDSYVKASVMIAKEKFLLDKRKKDNEKEEKERREQAIRNLKKMNGEWTLILLKNPDGFRRIHRDYSVTIKDNLFKMEYDNYEGEEKSYYLDILSYDPKSPRYSLELKTDDEDGDCSCFASMYLEKGASENEWKIYGVYLKEYNIEDDEEVSEEDEDDGNEKYGVIGRLTR